MSDLYLLETSTLEVAFFLSFCPLQICIHNQTNRACQDLEYVCIYIPSHVAQLNKKLKKKAMARINKTLSRIQARESGKAKGDETEAEDNKEMTEQLQGTVHGVFLGYF